MFCFANESQLKMTPLTPSSTPSPQNGRRLKRHIPREDSPHDTSSKHRKVRGELYWQIRSRTDLESQSNLKLRRLKQYPQRIEFTDIEGVVRTTKPHISLEFFHSKQPEEYNSVNDKWEEVGIIDGSRTHYVPLREDSITALEHYMKDDLTHFSNFFTECASPSLILRDLRSNLSEGPIFHRRAMQALFQSIYRRLRYGASLDDKVFRMGVNLIAVKLFEPNKPHEGRTSYTFEPLAPPPANSTEQEHPESWHQLHDDLLCLIQIPPDTPEVADRELAVYSHALLYAMMVEGALEAVGMAENIARDRLHHVIFGTKVAFAAVKVPYP